MSLRLADQVKHSFADWLHHSHSHNELAALSDRALEDIGNPGGRRVMKPQSPFGWPDWLGVRRCVSRGALLCCNYRSLGASARHGERCALPGIFSRPKAGAIASAGRKDGSENGREISLFVRDKRRVAYCSMIGQCRLWGWTQFSCSNAGSR